MSIYLHNPNTKEKGLKLLRLGPLAVFVSPIRLTIFAMNRYISAYQLLDVALNVAHFRQPF